MTTIHRFGRCEVRVTERQLRIDGKPHALGARAFDLLLTLIEHSDHVVTKNQLLDAVWPGLVVEEGNIAVHVAALRKLLGPASIATIPGRGYQFAAAPVGAYDRAEYPAAPMPVEFSLGPTTNLPGELPPLYGRDGELAELVQLLEQRRLVSIVGPAGIGKTRLGQAVAHASRDRFGHGVWLIELAALNDPARVIAAVAQTLGMTVSDEAVALDALIDTLRAKCVLLVLDNCEHLLNAVSTLVVAIRRYAPCVTLLLTSQVRLKVDDEHVYRLGTLAVPEVDTLPHAAAALNYGAVALFVTRVRALDRHFVVSATNVGAILEICRRLDGIALALEFAAARVPLLGVEGLCARLNECFKVISGGTRVALQRHQTLLAALEWSYSLLTAGERIVFCRLSVFAGGFPLEMAQDVAGDATTDKWQVLDHLAALVDKSLVVVDMGDPPRYRMLETSRAYAMERLVAAGVNESIACRHAHSVAAIFENAWTARWQAQTFDPVVRLQPELDNLRAALDWCNRNDSELEIALAGAAAWLWLGSGLDAEGITACERAISHLNEKTAPALEARVLSELAQLGWYVLPLVRALHALDRATALYRDTNDSVGLYLALGRKAGFLASGGHTDLARRTLVELESLEVDTWPLRLRLERLIARGRVLWFCGPLEEFQAALEERCQLASVVGNHRDRMLARGNLVLAKVGLGQLADAVRDGRELVDEFRRHGIAGAYLGYLLAFVAIALALGGRLNEALPILREATPALRAGRMVWRLLDLFALIALLCGRKDNAARLFGAGVAIFEKSGRQREIGLEKLHDVVFEQLHDAFSPERLTRLMHEGEAMSEQEAVASALYEVAAGI